MTTPSAPPVPGVSVTALRRGQKQHIEVKGEDGKAVRYGVEGASAQQFARQGVNKDALQVGDRVIVTGNPGRNPADHQMRLRLITRPSDGWKWNGDFD